MSKSKFIMENFYILWSRCLRGEFKIKCTKPIKISKKPTKSDMCYRKINIKLLCVEDKTYNIEEIVKNIQNILDYKK